MRQSRDSGIYFKKWKGALESKGSKDNIRNINVIVSGGSTKDGLSIMKAYPWGVCGLRVKVNSVLCL